MLSTASYRSTTNTLPAKSPPAWSKRQRHALDTVFYAHRSHARDRLPALRNDDPFLRQRLQERQALAELRDAEIWHA
jgi:hypothetical protein